MKNCGINIPPASGLSELIHTGFYRRKSFIEMIKIWAAKSLKNLEYALWDMPILRVVKRDKNHGRKADGQAGKAKQRKNEKS